MPREMFPVASMLVSLYHTVPQLVILHRWPACRLGWLARPGRVCWPALLGFGIVILLGTAWR